MQCFSESSCGLSTKGIHALHAQNTKPVQFAQVSYFVHFTWLYPYDMFEERFTFLITFGGKYHY